MICGVSKKLSTSSMTKTFVMKRAHRFFAATGFSICWGLMPLLAAVSAPETWVATWGSSQQSPEPQNELPVDDLRDATVRQIFHLSVGGSGLRVHISNEFGTEALHFTSVHIARPLLASSPSIDPSSDRPLTFAGKPDVLVPPGAEFISDSISLKVAALSDLAVTFHLDAPPARQTGHPGSRATSYYVRGDSVGAAPLIEPKHADHWFQISEIDVQTTPDAAAVVVLGDSITDGHGATTNGNDRWTDVLAARLQSLPQTQNVGVSNQGIGGNHLLSDGLGPNALSRFDRDVLAPAGVRWLIVFEGVNDLGGLARNSEVPTADHAALVERIVSAYGQLIDRAHPPRPRTPRLRGYDYTLRGFKLLPSRSVERSRSPGGESMDPRRWPFRRSNRFRSSATRSQSPRTPPPRLRLRRSPAPFARRIQSHG